MNSARVLAAPFKKAPCCPEPLSVMAPAIWHPQLAEARRRDVATVVGGLSGVPLIVRSGITRKLSHSLSLFFLR